MKVDWDHFLLFFYRKVNVINVYVTTRKKYGFWNFMLDCLMVGVTGGLWFIWIFVREMRKK